MSKAIRNRRKRIRKVLIIDFCVLIAVLGMFIFIKVSSNDPFAYKGEYKSLDIKGTWYKVDVDEMYTVDVKDNGEFVEKNSDGKITNKGTYKIGNHALKINQKSFKMDYTDEKSEIKSLTDDKLSDFQITEYFYIEVEGEDIYYFKDREAAANQVEDNCSTNQFYQKTGMFDENGFAIDGDDILLAYNGKAKEITIPDSVYAIGENAFSADYNRGNNLDKVTVPSTVKKISSGAFAFSKVKAVYVEQGVEEIDNWAFGDCNIKEVHLPGTVSILQEGIFDSEEGLQGMKIYCKENSAVDTYLKAHPPKGDYEIIYDTDAIQ